jgi:nicotinate dehydrogenase subunit A
VGARQLSQYRLRVNGREHWIEAEGSTALLYFLRNDLELNGPKYGCGLGECGACTVIIDGVAARSCVLPISLAADREIVTLEGLGSLEMPHPIQQAFIDAQAAQCGYCLNGMIMTVKALLDRNPTPTEAEIRNELRHNLCRCGAHVEILSAVMLAVERFDNAEKSRR